MAAAFTGTDSQVLATILDPFRVIFLPFWRILGRGTGPRGLEMAAACPGVDSQDLATILDPFRAIFADLGPDRLSET